MAEDDAAAQVDQQLWQRLPAENARDVAICKLCSALVYNKKPSRDHHVAWHERLIPGSTSRGAPD
jgi:hypothetical protein